jgi:hypothetical protein
MPEYETLGTHRKIRVPRRGPVAGAQEARATVRRATVT